MRPLANLSSLNENDARCISICFSIITTRLLNGATNSGDQQAYLLRAAIQKAMVAASMSAGYIDMQIRMAGIQRPRKPDRNNR